MNHAFFEQGCSLGWALVFPELVDDGVLHSDHRAGSLLGFLDMRASRQRQ